jgi:hypothetical protein
MSGLSVFSHARRRRATGYILHEDSERVIIATVNSDNRKTGNMIQIWILTRQINPVAAVRSGVDSLICGDCKLRGTDGFRGRTCYVNVGQGPSSVWRAYARGKYPYLPIEDYSRVFSGRAVRFGAYGDPVLVPLPIMRAIVAVASKHTGYTHQWRQSQYQAYREVLMASADNAWEQSHAVCSGWRTFHVRSASEPIGHGEISCPASDEMGNKTSCECCGLCNGSTGVLDARKNITIVAHGAGRNNLVQIS